MTREIGMLNFFGMIALGLACENVAMVVGMPWMGLFLIFWVISNVSTSFYDIEIAPGFYRWGYAWPLHSIVEGSRSILFGLHSRIGLDFGILIAWGAVNTALFPFCCFFMSTFNMHDLGSKTLTVRRMETDKGHSRVLALGLIATP